MCTYLIKFTPNYILQREPCSKKESEDISGGIHIFFIFFVHNDILCYKHSKYPRSSWTQAVEVRVKDKTINEAR
jgi:hypothetical protein